MCTDKHYMYTDRQWYRSLTPTIFTFKLLSFVLARLLTELLYASSLFLSQRHRSLSKVWRRWRRSVAMFSISFNVHSNMNTHSRTHTLNSHACTFVFVCVSVNLFMARNLEDGWGRVFSFCMHSCLSYLHFDVCFTSLVCTHTKTHTNTHIQSLLIVCAFIRVQLECA